MKRTKIKKGLKNKGLVIASGYFNPLHIGHLDYLREAKKLGNRLLVIINNDEQVKAKGNISFMNQKDRMKIIMSLQFVDTVMVSADKDKTVCETLRLIPLYHKADRMIFANGGDRREEDVPEKEICDKLGIEMVYGVGGEKKESSSSLIKNVQEKDY